MTKNSFRNFLRDSEWKASEKIITFCCHFFATFFEVFCSRRHNLNFYLFNSWNIYIFVQPTIFIPKCMPLDVSVVGSSTGLPVRSWVCLCGHGFACAVMGLNPKHSIYTFSDFYCQILSNIFHRNAKKTTITFFDTYSVEAGIKNRTPVAFYILYGYLYVFQERANDNT